MTQPTIRPLTPAEHPFLAEMLYAAIFVPEGEPTPPRSIIDQPALRHYWADFGKAGDVALVAEQDGQPIGAVWTRLFSAADKGYGFVDEQTPELSMALAADYRGQGIGTKLLVAMLEQLSQLGYKRVSLSVDPRNFAYPLYQRHGFQAVADDGHSLTMVKSWR